MIFKFSLSTDSPRPYSISEETIGRAVSLETGFPVQDLQVSISRLLTVDTGTFDSLTKYRGSKAHVTLDTIPGVFSKYSGIQLSDYSTLDRPV